MSSSSSIQIPPVNSNVATNPFSTPQRLSRAPSVDDHSTSVRPASYFPGLLANGMPSAIILEYVASANNTRNASTKAKEIQKCATCRRRVSFVINQTLHFANRIFKRLDDKPWAVKHPKLKWERAIFYGSVGIGVVIGAVICYLAYASVTNHSVSRPRWLRVLTR